MFFFLRVTHVSKLTMSLSLLTKMSKKVFNGQQNIRKNSMRAFFFLFSYQVNLFFHFFCLMQDRLCKW